MQKNPSISVLAGCAALVLVLGLTVLGCGGSDPAVSTPGGSQDDANLAGQCTDTCTTIMLHAQITEAEMDGNMAVCEANCNAPATEQDTAVRDCSIGCDLSLSAEEYLSCQCDCGLTAVCDLPSPANYCTDTCTTLMACVEEVTDVIPDGQMDAEIASCEQDCNDPGAAEDVAVRDCAIGCDLNLDCADYLDCMCFCGMTGLCL